MDLSDRYHTYQTYHTLGISGNDFSGQDFYTFRLSIILGSLDPPMHSKYVVTIVLCQGILNSHAHEHPRKEGGSE